MKKQIVKKLVLFALIASMSCSLSACFGGEVSILENSSSLESSANGEVSSVENSTSSVSPLKQGVSYVSLENALPWTELLMKFGIVLILCKLPTTGWRARF